MIVVLEMSPSSKARTIASFTRGLNPKSSALTIMEASVP